MTSLPMISMNFILYQADISGVLDCTTSSDEEQRIGEDSGEACTY